MLGQGKEVTEKSMEDVMAKEIASMNTRIYYLNLIGVVTPMIGLTGTVLGMMNAFKTLGTSGIGDPSALAGAIGEVLVATASGLVGRHSWICQLLLFPQPHPRLSSATPRK